MAVAFRFEARTVAGALAENKLDARLNLYYENDINITHKILVGNVG